jgi:hypothetical protein
MAWPAPAPCSKTAALPSQTLNLFVTGQVPADADVILLVDQFAPLSPDELAAITAYLDQGGAAFIARDVPKVPASRPSRMG